LLVVVGCFAPDLSAGNKKPTADLVSGGLCKILGLSFYDFCLPRWATAQTMNARCIEQMLGSVRFIGLAVTWIIDLSPS
jgi:hypothetical protein